MIYSSINTEKTACALPELIRKGLHWIETHDVAHMAPGVYEIEGQDLLAQVQNQHTVKPSEKQGESHFKYVDVQYLVSGDEYQGYRLLRPEDRKLGDANEEKDIIKYDNAVIKDEQYIHLVPGDFTVYFTNDYHKANLTLTEGMDLRKVVLKVREAALS